MAHEDDPDVDIPLEIPNQEGHVIGMVFVNDTFISLC